MRPLILAFVLFAAAIAVEAYGQVPQGFVSDGSISVFELSDESKQLLRDALLLRDRVEKLEQGMKSLVECDSMRDAFVEAAEQYVALGRKFRAVKALNLAIEAVTKGCWLSRPPS